MDKVTFLKQIPPIKKTLANWPGLSSFLQALSDEGQPTRVVVIRIEVPVVEVERIVVSLEVERMRGGPPTFIALFHP